MALYSVFLPRDRSPEAVERGIVLVRDGFSFSAMIFGPLWFLRHREWLGLIGWLLIAVLIGAGRTFAGPVVTGGLELIFVIATGIVAADVRRLSLWLFGHEELGAIEGDSIEAAERRFFEAWLPGRPALTPTTAMPAGRSPARADGVPGFFPDSGVRS